MPTVGSNNWNGGLLATRHLLELGHRRIAVISGPEDVLCSQARVAGFRSAHDEAGHPGRPGAGPVRQVLRRTPATSTAMDLLTRPDRPTAIFAGSDMQAMGVLRAARQLGLRVPGDLSVIGYDNLPMAAWVDPALTTVNQPLRDMAGTATRMLLDLAAGVERADQPDRPGHRAGGPREHRRSRAPPLITSDGQGLVQVTWAGTPLLLVQLPMKPNQVVPFAAS